jgi:hypothetical protein
MWTFVIIISIGMVIFFATSCTIILMYNSIEKRLRFMIAITSLPMLLGMMSLLSVTSALDEARKDSEVLFKKMKKQEKYELIQEPVYRKIK